MPLQCSGAISFSQMRDEFLGSNPVRMSQYYRGGSLVANSAFNTNNTVPFGGSAIAASQLRCTTRGGNFQNFTAIGQQNWFPPANVDRIQCWLVGGGGGSAVVGYWLNLPYPYYSVTGGAAGGGGGGFSRIDGNNFLRCRNGWEYLSITVGGGGGGSNPADAVPDVIAQGGGGGTSTVQVVGPNATAVSASGGGGGRRRSWFSWNDPSQSFGGSAGTGNWSNGQAGTTQGFGGTLSLVAVRNTRTWTGSRGVAAQDASVFGGAEYGFGGTAVSSYYGWGGDWTGSRYANSGQQGAVRIRW